MNHIHLHQLNKLSLTCDELSDVFYALGLAIKNNQPTDVLALHIDAVLADVRRDFDKVTAEIGGAE